MHVLTYVCYVSQHPSIMAEKGRQKKKRRHVSLRFCTFLLPGHDRYCNIDLLLLARDGMRATPKVGGVIMFTP